MTTQTGMRVDLSHSSKDDLLAMKLAGEEVMACLGAIGRSGSNPVGRILKHAGPFYEESHYPDDDVSDKESGSQYYYHAHRGTDEHGHFHTFVRATGIPGGIEPAPYSGQSDRPLGSDAICHLIAVSMNANGLPIGLFTTNRWVTAESFYGASDTIRILENFNVDHAEPCWATNRWLTGLLKLFRPQIIALIEQRDAAIEKWAKEHPGDVFEDRELEVTSEAAIDIDDQIEAVDHELAKRP